MRVHRLLLCIVTVLGVLFPATLFPATATSAHPPPPPSYPPPSYPPPPPSLTASAGTVFVGATVTIVGNGFGGCDLIRIYITYQTTAGAVLSPARCGAVPPAGPPGFNHSVTADANGHFQTIVSLTTVGTATITAVGFPSGFSASTTVIVLAAAQQQMASQRDSGRPGLSISAGAVAAFTVPLLALALALIRRRARAKADT
jgi:hypothetical protein